MEKTYFSRLDLEENKRSKLLNMNTPSDPKLYARVKMEAKKKFRVFPSAYASAWIVKEYKKRGGKYK